jgi:hypothetical protein
MLLGAACAMCVRCTHTLSLSVAHARAHTHSHARVHAHSVAHAGLHTRCDAHTYAQRATQPLRFALIASDDCFGVNGTITKATSTVNCQMKWPYGTDR